MQLRFVLLLTHPVSIVRGRNSAVASSSTDYLLFFMVFARKGKSVLCKLFVTMRLYFLQMFCLAMKGCCKQRGHIGSDVTDIF